MDLLVDCGNSCVKLALAKNGHILRWQRCEIDPQQWQSFMSGALIERALVAPGAQKSVAAFRKWCPVTILEVGVELAEPASDHYPGCGLDRRLAAFGYHRLFPHHTRAILIDAGTATTLSAWDLSVTPMRILGGLILPSAQACLDGLHQAAPALPSVRASDQAAPTASGRSPVQAIDFAMRIAYPAMVLANAKALADEYPETPLCITGGNQNALKRHFTQARFIDSLIFAALLGLAHLDQKSDEDHLPA